MMERDGLRVEGHSQNRMQGADVRNSFRIWDFGFLILKRSH
jgi:hypothetical protein